jgi:hypothetical protein
VAFRIKNIFLHTLILTALFLFPGMSSAQGCSEALAFKDVQFRFVKEQGNVYIETIGILQNTSKEKVGNPQIVVWHLDAQKRLIDMQQNFLYGRTLAPGEDLAFRRRDIAAHPQSVYASHEPRIVDCVYGKAGTARFSGNVSNAASTNLTLLYVALFLLAFVIALVVMTRKYTGARSPILQAQERQFKWAERQGELLAHQVELLERQLELTAQNNVLFERIARALEDRNKS